MEQVKTLSAGGVHLAAEFAGAMPALELAIEVTRRGGRTVTAALPNPSDRLSLAAARLVTEERTLMGSTSVLVFPRETFQTLLRSQKGSLVERMILAHARINGN